MNTLQDTGRPTVVKPRFENAPAFLKALRIWVVWRLEYDPEYLRWTKVPYDALSRKLAATDDPSTWRTFDRTVEGYNVGSYDGIGFCNDGTLTFVDIDGCRDPITGEMAEWAVGPLNMLTGYKEVSVTGTGVHAVVRGQLPAGRRELKRGPHEGIALYPKGRYFTFSGEALPSSTENWNDQSEALAELHVMIFPAKNGHHRQHEPPLELADDDLIRRALHADDRGKFARLWRGEWQADYPSQSEGDAALAMKLAFWTARDAPRIDRLFRRSGLMREKWEREDYRQRTIEEAIKTCDEVYTGHQNHARAARSRCVATTGDEWPDPVSLKSELPPVEPMTELMIPVSMRILVVDVAERMQVPLDYPAVASVLCLAGVVNRRVMIQPKARDCGWVVVPNLWGGIIAPPGFMKSPVIQAVTRPLIAIQAAWRRLHEDALAEYANEKEEAELRRAAWRDQYKANAKKSRSVPDRPTDSPSEPTLRRLILNDSTFEAMHQTMSENPAGIFVIRDELTGWWSTLDRPGREGERAFCLQAWNGDTGHTIDRIGRGTIHVPACCMSMLGGIQPGRLRSYLVDALEDGPGNDGLIQRFQLLVWPDTDSDWHYVDRPADPDAEALVESVFRRLVDLDLETPPRYRFTAEAQELFIEFMADLETKIRRGDLHPALISHLSKYRSLMPSLAVLFELVDQAGCVGVDGSSLGKSQDYCVSLEHTRQAAVWCDYLESHACRVYSCIVTPKLRAARDLADKVRQRKIGAKGTITCRDVYLKGWSGLDSPEAVKAAAEVLEDAQWLRDITTEPGFSGGRPSNKYAVNPKVYQ